MSASDRQAEPKLPWYKKLLMVLLFPCVVIGLLLAFVAFLVLGTMAFISVTMADYKFRASLRRCGRLLNQRDLADHIATDGAGTLIIEMPYVGWGSSRAWWTPDKVLGMSPYSEPSDDERERAANRYQRLSWDRWLWDNYTNPESGRGLLLQFRNGRSLAPWVAQNFPAIDVVQTWTGFAQIDAPDAGAIGEAAHAPQ